MLKVKEYSTINHSSSSILCMKKLGAISQSYLKEIATYIKTIIGEVVTEIFLSISRLIFAKLVEFYFRSYIFFSGNGLYLKLDCILNSFLTIYYSKSKKIVPQIHWKYQFSTNRQN